MTSPASTRVQTFWSSIYTTDEELLDLLDTDTLRRRLDILRSHRAPLLYRAIITALLDQRA